MISEGNIGLMYAIDKFEPEKGFRFSTYALWWIKASVQKYILNSWSLVKLGTTAAQKKLFFNLRKIKNQLNLIDDRELSQKVLANIAQSLDVSVQDVTDMNMRLKSHDGSLNTIIDGDSDGTTEWLDFISDSKPNQEEKLAHTETMQYRKQMFNKALYVLNKREKDILFKRRLYEKTITLDDLSKFYNISKERVTQIELNSIKKISKAIELMQ
jgi:RNA polymerase sigma-32 factor